MRVLKVALVAGALAGLSLTSALAAGGGGGGGMSTMPSDTGPRYDPAEEYAKAVKAIQARDYKTAARSAQRVADAAPNNVDGWKLLGVAQTGAENWKGAKKAYEKALKLSPEDMAARSGLGVAAARLQDAKVAQEQLAWLKARQAGCTADCETLKSLSAEVEKALSPTAAGAGGQPAAALERGTLLFAEAGDRAYVEAVGLINEKRYDAALASLADARRAFGPHPDILTYQGYAWRKKGDSARAETYYRQALAIAPDHRGATEYYGELKVERGDLAGARLMLAKLDAACAYGCAEAEELRRWVAAGRDPGL